MIGKTDLIKSPKNEVGKYEAVVHELSNDEYSRGGYSSNKKVPVNTLNSIVSVATKPLEFQKMTSNLESHSLEDLTDNPSHISSQNNHLDYRSIQHHKSVMSYLPGQSDED